MEQQQGKLYTERKVLLDNGYILVKEKRDRFYPLIIYQTSETYSGSGVLRYKNRSVKRNTVFDHRFGAMLLHILYARQLAKKLTKRGRPLMELPYTMSYNCNDTICKNYCLAEYEFNKFDQYTLRQNSPSKRAVDIDVNDIVESDLES